METLTYVLIEGNLIDEAIADYVTQLICIIYNCWTKKSQREGFNPIRGEKSHLKVFGLLISSSPDFRK